MAKGCKKCDPHEICEECPEWIFTLADLIMCMMGLFVILWVLKKEGAPATNAANTPQEMSQRELEVIGEIRAGFGYVPDPNSSDPVDVAMFKKKLRLGQVDLEKGVQEQKQEATEGTDPNVTNIRESKLAAIGTKLDFVRGKSQLSADAKKALDSIAREIRGTRFIVIVKGHASRDDFPEDATAAQFMDVSIKRAQDVADYLVNVGVSPDILRVQGCSYFEPLKQSAFTRDAQQINRRVEVFATEMLVKDLQDPKRTSQEPVK